MSNGERPPPAPPVTGATRLLGAVWIDDRGSEVLVRGECLRLLALAARRGDIGRIGIPTETSPVVVPVNFGYWETEVLLRVGPGTLAELIPGSLVAFEVDDVDRGGGVAWSVLVRGLARALPTHDVHRLWRHLPEPLAPRPGDLVFSIRSDVVTGRRFALSHPRSRRPERIRLPVSAARHQPEPDEPSPTHVVARAEVRP